MAGASWWESVGTVVPAGTGTKAVFSRLRVAAAEAVPVTVKTTELPAPAAMFSLAVRLLLEPVAPAVTEAVPAVLEVHVTPVSVAGIVSAMVAPVTLLGAAFVTVMV